MKKNSNKKASKKSAKDARDLASVAAMVPSMVATLDKLGHQVFGGGPKKGKDTAARSARDATALPVGYASFLKPSFSRRSIKGGARVKGTDFLTQVEIPDADHNVVGALLAAISVNPQSLGAVRLAQIAPMFRRFIFRKFNLVYLPSQGTNTNGQILLAFSHDAEAEVPQGDQFAIQQLLSWNDSITGSVYTPLEMRSTQVIPETPFWVDLIGADSERHIYQGQAVLALSNPVNTISGAAISYPATIGTLYVDYEIDLLDEQLEAEHPLSVVYASGNFNNMPSTSIGHCWDGALVSPSPQESAGDTEFFIVSEGNGGNGRIMMPPGCFHVTTVMAFTPNGTNSVTVGQSGSDPLTFSANDSEVQSAFGYETDLDNSTLTSPFYYYQVNTVVGATTLNYQWSQGFNVVIPEGGGNLAATWYGSNVTACSEMAQAVMIEEIDPSILRTLNPPSVASSRARCRMDPHPRRGGSKAHTASGKDSVVGPYRREGLQNSSTVTRSIKGVDGIVEAAADSAKPVPVGALPLRGGPTPGASEPMADGRTSLEGVRQGSRRTGGA